MIAGQRCEELLSFPVVLKCMFFLFVLQDLGVRIPRPLGNGPSRFIPEKEVRDGLLTQ